LLFFQNFLNFLPGDYMVAHVSSFGKGLYNFGTNLAGGACSLAATTIIASSLGNIAIEAIRNAGTPSHALNTARAVTIGCAGANVIAGLVCGGFFRFVIRNCCACSGGCFCCAAAKEAVKVPSGLFHFGTNTAGGCLGTAIVIATTWGWGKPTIEFLRDINTDSALVAGTSIVLAATAASYGTGLVIGMALRKGFSQLSKTKETTILPV
jgi:hypothetical protein